MTLEEFWNQTINDKWVPVIIEGKRIKSPFLRDELFVKNDNVVNPWYGELNDRNGFRKSVIEEAGIPSIELPGISLISRVLEKKFELKRIDSEELRLSLSNLEYKEKELWEKWWGFNPCSGDESIFSTDVREGRCFYDIKTGKIKPTIRYAGKWCESVSALREEVEWFSESFPDVDLYVTVIDHSLVSYKEKEILHAGRYKEYEIKPLGTLHLYNGKIELVKTKKYKNLDKIPSICCSKARVFWGNLKFKFIRLYYNIVRHVDYGRYVYWHNYALLNFDYSRYRSLLSDEEAMRKIHYWKDIAMEKCNLREYIYKNIKL